MIKKLHTFSFYILLFTVFALPLHAFVSIYLNYGLGVSEFIHSNVITMWKEMVFILLFIIVCTKFFLQKTFPRFDKLDAIIIAYIVFGCVHFVLAKLGLFGGEIRESLNVTSFVFGARYDYMFLIAFLIVRHLNFSKSEKGTLMFSMLYGGIFAVVVSFILHFVVGPENFVQLGFRDDWSTWIEGESLAFCQRLEHSETCRMSGTFAGPNQFGAYLVLLTPLLFMFKKAHKYVWMTLTLIALYFTYSRGAYLGLIAAAISYFVMSSGLLVGSKNPFKKLVDMYTYHKFNFGVLVLIILVVVLAAIQLIDPEMIIRPDSTNEHIKAWSLGFSEFFAHPYGQGIGSAGPASYRTASPIIPESWYLQVLVEYGVFGLLLFLGAMLSVLKSLYKNNAYKVAASLIGLLTIALFLHTFEDSSVSLTLAVALAIACATNIDKNRFSI